MISLGLSFPPHELEQGAAALLLPVLFINAAVSVLLARPGPWMTYPFANDPALGYSLHQKKQPAILSIVGAKLGRQLLV